MAECKEPVKSGESETEEDDEEVGSHEPEKETRKPSSATLKKAQPLSSASLKEEQQKQPTSSSDGEESGSEPDGADPNVNVGVTGTELQDDMRRGKGKFEERARESSERIRENDNGGDAGVANSEGSGNASKKTPSKRASVTENSYWWFPKERENFNDFQKWILSLGERFFEEAEGMYAGETEWKKLKYEQMELKLRELELKRARTKLVLDALKAGGDH